MYNEEDYLQLSGIQHFCFCRRQWALIHLEQQWEENVLTAHGRHIHERVHEEGTHDLRSGIWTLRGLQVHSAKLGLSGTCDAVEFVPSEQGITLFERPGKWLVRPVEYKNGTVKVNDCDRLQVTAQAMCLEEMLCCSVPEAHIFYHKIRRREKMTITEDLRQAVARMTEEMHRYTRAGHTPSVKPTEKCKSCSLQNICLPQMLKAAKKQSVSDYLTSALKEETF